MRFVTIITILTLTVFALIGMAIGWNLKEDKTVYKTATTTVEKIIEVPATSTNANEISEANFKMAENDDCELELSNCWYAYNQIKNKPDTIVEKECSACEDNMETVKNLEAELIKKEQAIKELSNAFDICVKQNN